MSHKVKIELEVEDTVGYDELEEAVLETRDVKRIYSIRAIDYLEE